MKRKDTHCKKLILLLLPVFFCFVLVSCGGGGGNEGGGGADADPAGFEPAAFKDAEFSEGSAEGGGEAMVDLSSTSRGYVGVLCNSDAKIKVQVMKDDETYTYDVQNGDPAILPLQCGDGTYIIKVMKNVEDNKYYELYSTSAAVTLENVNAPYVIPNMYSNYSESSDCVQKAAELADKAESESEFVDSVYQYICKGVDYDFDEAKTVSTGYIPDPDEVMNSGEGICIDYASLAAAMLRSQGIPTKIIFGYVAPDNLYHAWNMFYTEETGWTTVKFSVSPGDWSRIDLTFAANGEDSTFIGDGSNYQEVYQY